MLQLQFLIADKTYLLAFLLRLTGRRNAMHTKIVGEQ